MNKRRAITGSPPPSTPAEPLPATAPAATDGLFWEAKVADALGISRERVRSIRSDHLKDGEHFRVVRNEVVLTEAGLARLHELIAPQDKTAPNTPEPASSKFAVTAGPPRRARFEVAKIMANSRLLSCLPEGRRDARPVLVHVKSNLNFMPRMTLEAIEAEHGTWQFRGRLPRRRGKW